MKQNLCNEVQESIALNKQLPMDLKAHADNCQDCQLIATEYETLTFLMRSHLDGNVSDSFADKVMNAIELDNAVTVDDWFTKIQQLFSGLMAKPIPQFLFLSMGFAVSGFNLIRFVLFVLIPA